MPEGRAPISSSRIATGDIARHSFAIVRRGFDTDEVRAYLQSVSRSIEAFEEREQELRAAVAEAEERAAHPVVDEATLTVSLGQHSAQILRHAHEEAARIVAQAQEGAATLLRETQSQVDELQARTEASSAERVVEVELLVANAEQEARVDSERILAEAVADGEAVIARAKDEGRALLEQVQEARRRVLADLASRRRALGIQIEQLRAARDEMAASVLGVRDKVDGILAHLERTDEEARAAAMAVGDQFRLHGADDGPHDQDSVDEATGESPGTAASGEGPGAEPGEDAAGAPAAAPSVDELFARIRAGTGETGGPAKAAAPGALPEAQAGEAGADGGGSVVGPQEGEAAAAEAAAPKAEAPPGPDDELIARRDELLAPVTARLSRTVKRALGDDQNRLLDRFRSAPSLTVDELLGPEDEHMAGFAAAARSHLTEAFAAGTAFGGAGKATVPAGDAIEQSEEGLARVVVTMLRRQMADGGGELSDRVGAAFREWRGERVERLAGDYATQAFSAGVIAAGGDSKVRWVVTSASGCSDCEDNALAGAVSASETFPTGHAHPPAHSGCRCLVAPADD
ncbi:MAG: DivIVA domain-containing protein [Acidimicrobiales bacterium]|jgi:DivIVA domain-containing protein